MNEAGAASTKPEVADHEQLARTPVTLGVVLAIVIGTSGLFAILFSVVWGALRDAEKQTAGVAADLRGLTTAVTLLTEETRKANASLDLIAPRQVAGQGSGGARTAGTP